MKKYSIAILGIGGVGGYIGGKLAASHVPGVRIIFVARGETREVLQKDGLRLITEDGEIVARPDLVSDDPAEIGPVDLLICAMKGYDLEAGLTAYRGCLAAGTVILPLLNGIGIADKVRAIVPGIECWDGLIYIVARQTGKGIVRQTGALREIVFGSAKASPGDLQKVASIFGSADMKATVADNIDLELWRKFLFISVMATLTCYYRSPIGEIRRDPERARNIPNLLHELQSVAVANGIAITDELMTAVR
ncbi:MAG TPA: 2-dehydropantoate 2-reductase, partial [Puia sp.]|nr:2-dehydropantoate 2-reductase [Puia sp.]